MTTAAEEGKKLYVEKKYEEAVVAFTKALEGEEDVEALSRLHSNRCACLMHLSKFSEAEDDAETCTSLKPTWSKGWGRLGTAKEARHKFLEAAAAFEKASELGERAYDKDAKRARDLSARASSYYASRAFTGTTAKKPLVVESKWLEEFQFVARLGILVTFVGYCVAFSSKSMSGRYTACVRFVIASYLVHVIRYHGRPRFTSDYARRVITDSVAQRGFGAFVLLVGSSFMPLFVFVYIEVAHLAASIVDRMPAESKFSQKLLDAFSSLRLLDSRTKEVDATVFQNAATLEVAAGFVVVLELLTPRRSFAFLALYWQYLQLKYMLESAEAQANNIQGPGPLRQAFAGLDAKIESLLESPAAPSFLKAAYTTLKATLSKQVAVPKPGEKPKPRCSVM